MRFLSLKPAACCLRKVTPVMQELFMTSPSVYHISSFTSLDHYSSFTMPEKSLSELPHRTPRTIHVDNVGLLNHKASSGFKAQRKQDDTFPGYSESSRLGDSSISTRSQQILTTPGLPNIKVLAYLPHSRQINLSLLSVIHDWQQIRTLLTSLLD